MRKSQKKIKPISHNLVSWILKVDELLQTGLEAGLAVAEHGGPWWPPHNQVRRKQLTSERGQVQARALAWDSRRAVRAHARSRALLAGLRRRWGKTGLGTGGWRETPPWHRREGDCRRLPAGWVFSPTHSSRPFSPEQQKPYIASGG